MVIEYEWRRRPNDEHENEWHCCYNCQNWPGDGGDPKPEVRWVESNKRPHGEVCEHCQGLRDEQRCKRNQRERK